MSNSNNTSSKAVKQLNIDLSDLKTFYELRMEVGTLLIDELKRRGFNDDSISAETIESIILETSADLLMGLHRNKIADEVERRNSPANKRWWVNKVVDLLVGTIAVIGGTYLAKRVFVPKAVTPLGVANSANESPFSDTLAAMPRPRRLASVKDNALPFDRRAS